MRTFRTLSFILLSSNARTVAGSNIRGAVLEKAQEKQQSLSTIAMQSVEVIGVKASKEYIDEEKETNDLFEELEDKAHDLLAEPHTQLSDEISSVVFEGNPDLDEKNFAHTREAFIELLEEDNNAPDVSPDTSLSFNMPAGVIEDDQIEDGEVVNSDGDFEFPVDANAPAKDDNEVPVNGDRQRGLGYYRYSKSSKSSKSYKDYHYGHHGRYSKSSKSSKYSKDYYSSSSNDYYSSYYKKYGYKSCRNYDKGYNHSDYDLHEYVSKGYCEKKCNDLGHYCYGYEYFSYDNKCEIWKAPIYYVDYSHESDCYVKNHY